MLWKMHLTLLYSLISKFKVMTPISKVILRGLGGSCVPNFKLIAVKYFVVSGKKESSDGQTDGMMEEPTGGQMDRQLDR